MRYLDVWLSKIYFNAYYFSSKYLTTFWIRYVQLHMCSALEKKNVSAFKYRKIISQLVKHKHVVSIDMKSQ